MRVLSLILILFGCEAFAKGAIAYSMNPDGTWFVFAEWNQPTSTQAQDAAIQGCKGKGGTVCKIIKSLDNGCASVAITNEGKFALGQSDSQTKAQDKSVAACLVADPGGSCVVRKSFCDNTGGFIPSDASLTPVNPGPTQFFCRSGRDYSRCMTPGQGPPALGGAAERERYCRMAFC